MKGLGHPKIPSTDVLFSREIIDLLNFIQAEGFILTLVGGAVRDYLLYQKIPDDLDFEIRRPGEESEDAWKNFLTSLADDLRKKFHLKMEFLEFGIFKFFYHGKNFEFSSPRVELFEEDKKKWNHKDFAVALLSNLDYPAAFVRRDFTINAIGFELLENRAMRLIDPLQGVLDLERKVLRPCGSHFFKDPIRFLRLLRFAINTGFEISSEIRLKLDQFNLEDLTHSYFLKEAFKTNPLKFFRLFFHHVTQAFITCNPQLVPLFFLAKDDDVPSEQARQIKDEKSLNVWMIFSKRYLDKNILEFAHYAKVNKTFMKNMFGLRDGLMSLLVMDLQPLLSLLTQAKFGELPEQKDLVLIGDFYTSYKRSSKQMAAYLPLLPDPLLKRVYQLWEEIFSFYPRDLNTIGGIPPASRKAYGIFLMLKNYHETRQKLPK